MAFDAVQMLRQTYAHGADAARMMELAAGKGAAEAVPPELERVTTSMNDAPSSWYVPAPNLIVSPSAACASMIPLVILARPWQKILAALFAILMGLSRIYLCVHFPSDVLGGLIVGLFAGCMAVLIARKLPRGWYAWEFGKKTAQAGRHEIR